MKPRKQPVVFHILCLVRECLHFFIVFSLRQAAENLFCTEHGNLFNLPPVQATVGFGFNPYREGRRTDVSFSPPLLDHIWDSFNFLPNQ